jgi:hypothetical protein
MFGRAPHLVLWLVAFALLAAACSSASGQETSTTTTTSSTTTTTTEPPTTTTTSSTTTTTTLPGVEVSDAINGLPAEEDLVDRRMVAIKIDNHPNARPQSGLEQADAVFEVLVEGGLTRFIAMFHQTDVDYVGPNRSGRVTDSKVMAAMSGSPIQISGAQGWVKDIFAADDINVSYDTGATTYRSPLRPKPHNLYTSTLMVREYADERGWPDESPGNLFAFGEPTPGEVEATRIAVPFSDVPPSTWAWDGEQYLHFQGTEAHEWVDADGATGQIAFDTLVVMKMRKYIARNPAGSGTALPTVETTGSGEALVFHSGSLVDGTWAREAIEDPFELTARDGTTLVLPPGTVWVHLVPDTMTVTWE